MQGIAGLCDKPGEPEFLVVIAPDRAGAFRGNKVALGEFEDLQVEFPNWLKLS